MVVIVAGDGDGGFDDSATLTVCLSLCVAVAAKGRAAGSWP